MKTRTLLIILGSVALVALLCAGAAAGGALAYLAVQARPVQALGLLPAIQVNQDSREAGILVAHVEEGSPAAEAGLARGDILLEVNGETVNAPVDLFRILEEMDAGDPVELQVLHGDDQRTLTVTLQDRNGRPYLGLAPCGFPAGGDLFFYTFPTRGALVTEVLQGSPAEQAGLKEGDQILAVDGTEVGPDDNLRDLIGAHQPGDTVTLTVARPDEDDREVQVELGENPDQAGQAYLGIHYIPSAPAAPMIEGRPFLRPFGRLPGFDPSFELPAGVDRAAVIGRVLPDSPADQAGLQPGDAITEVDGQPLENAQSLAEAVQSRQPGDMIALTVIRAGEDEPINVEVTVGEDPDETGKAYLGLGAVGFIHVEREENGGKGRNFDFNFIFPGPPFFEKVRERLFSGKTL